MTYRITDFDPAPFASLVGADPSLRQLFAKPAVRYIYAHDAIRGCFAAAVERT